MQVLLPLLLAFSLAAAQGDPARQAFESAARALASNDLPAAEQGFQQVLKLQPKNVGALGNLGVVYSKMGRFGDARRIYQQALRQAPADPQLNLNLALAYLKQDDYKSAIPPLSLVLEKRPDHAQAKELLATARLFTGDTAAATSALESLRSAGGSSVLYLLAISYLKAGRREDAQHMIDRLFSSITPAEAHLLTGRAYYESTLFDNAVGELEKARDLAPEQPGIWRELGKTYVSLRRAEDAQRSLTEAIRRDSSDAEAQYFLGALLVQQHSVEEGVRYLEKARASRPDFWGSYYYLGRAALAQQHAAEAVRHLKRASELHPDDPSVLYQLSRALKSAGQATESKKIAARLVELRGRERVEEQQALVEK